MEAEAEPLASPASPSLASLALGALLASWLLAAQVSGGLWLSGEGGGQYDEGPVQASACGARRALGEGLVRSGVSSAPARQPPAARQGLRLSC